MGHSSQDSYVEDLSPEQKEQHMKDMEIRNENFKKRSTSVKVIWAIVGIIIVCVVIGLIVAFCK